LRISRIAYEGLADLIDRFKRYAVWNRPEKVTVCGGGTKGYIDHPVATLWHLIGRNALRSQCFTDSWRGGPNGAGVKQSE
jgi:hypothetical protein